MILLRSAVFNIHNLRSVALTQTQLDTSPVSTKYMSSNWLFLAPMQLNTTKFMVVHTILKKLTWSWLSLNLT